MNKEFWSKRYQENQTGWDIGTVSSPIKEYIDQLEDRSLKILIPGAGNSYEAEYLFESGFSNVYLCDIAREPLENFIKRNPGFPKDQIIESDFFLVENRFDLILEQTFFCAIALEKRPDYAKKAAELLNKNGILVGLLFDFKLSTDGPPFGGSKEEYLTYFSPYFKIEIFERSYNSIKPRQGKELFFKFRKK